MAKKYKADEAVAIQPKLRFKRHFVFALTVLVIVYTMTSELLMGAAYDMVQLTYGYNTYVGFALAAYVVGFVAYVYKKI